MLPRSAFRHEDVILVTFIVAWLLVPEVRRDWTDCLMLIRRKQQLKQPLVTPEECRKASQQQQKTTAGAIPVN